MKLELRQIFEEHSNIRFYENSTSCSMQTDRRTDMTKLAVAFCSLANAP